MKRMKEVLYSERGMKIVNTLFFLSMAFYTGVLLLTACTAWIVYLVFCIKHTESKGSKIVYSAFIGIAVIIICGDLYLLLRSYVR